MKKVLSMLLVLMVVMSMTAFAVETYVPDNDGTYSIGFTEGANGNYYALLVVEGKYAEGETPIISEDTVLYIDQGTADANGDVTFDGWIPKGEEGTEATVYLGGASTSPVLLGYLGAKKFVVSGTVTSDSTYEATVTLTNGEETYTATSVGGAYTVEVPEGTYTFTVNVKNHLSYTDNDFAVTGDFSGKDAYVKGGDIDASGKVDYDDLMVIINNYNTENEEVEINAVDTVNYDDLMIIINNYNQSAIVE